MPLHTGRMRTRADVERDMLDTMADVHRCDQADDEVGAAFARDTLCRLGDEWPTIPEQRTDPEARFTADKPFHSG